MNRNRFHNRNHEVTGQLPGKLLLPNSHTYVIAKATDVSRHGFGVIAESSAQIGSMMWLVLPDRYIKFEVVYCKPDPKDANLYRIGLTRRGSDDDIEKVFSSFGCLRYKQSTGTG